MISARRIQKPPSVSIVMVNYNREPFIGAAIESVWAQTVSDWELILVENGSTDHSLRTIERWIKDEPRVRLLTLPRRVAIPVAANLGIRETTADFIARLDSDDIWVSNHLKTQLDWLELEEQLRVGVCGAQCQLIDVKGDIIGAKRFPITDSECRRALWYRNPFCHSAVLIRKRALAQLGLYDENFPIASDLELWMRLSQSFQLHNLPEVGVYERVWGESVRMRNHREMISVTLKARRLASMQYGHRMGMEGRLAFALTWVAGWCPPAWSRWLFHSVLGAFGDFEWTPQKEASRVHDRSPRRRFIPAKRR